MSTLQAPSVRQRRLGAALRRLRDTNNLSSEEVGERLGWSASKISRLETAKIGARLSDIRLLLELYSADERHRGELLALAHDATERGWWNDYAGSISSDYATFIALETDAAACRSWDAQVIPGLLQTEDYARQIIGAWDVLERVSPREVERRIQVRLRRQQVLTKGRPLELSVVMDEAVLYRRVGDDDVMRAQLGQLNEAAQRPNINLCILPLDRPHDLITESFILLEFSPAYDVTIPDVVHMESLTAIHFEDESVTHKYRLTFEALAKQAHSPEESRELVMAACDRWR